MKPLSKSISVLVILSMIISVLNFGGVFAAGDETASEQAALSADEPRQMEYLSRGAIGATVSGGVFMSWRLLGTEPTDTKFNVYCNGELIAENLDATNYTHMGGNANNVYQIAPVIGGEAGMLSKSVEILTDFADYPYVHIDLVKPDGGSTTSGSFEYTANDCSVGDVDGDGEYEIILKWDPTNSKDNSQSGYTGNVLLDCYKLDGTRVWSQNIDLGVNIRAGAHYTQFMVYDFDGDGKSEIICKTGPGSKDATGAYVTEAGATSAIRDADNSRDYRNSRGHVTSGGEYLTVFSGETGEALQTVDYDPPRDVTSNWGDGSYNRSERYLAAVAYLDGVRPSVLMCRGYYTNAYIAAYTWDGTNLTEQWLYSGERSSSTTRYADGSTKTSDITLYGQGNHNLSVADIDGDGYDELIYGAAALDHDGTPIYNKGWGHGDATHVGDFDGDGRLEVFTPHEDNPAISLRDAKSGTTIFRDTSPSGDVGRGIIGNYGSNYKYIMWSSAKTYGAVDKGDGAYEYEEIPSTNGTFSNGSSANFNIYWDGDLYREELDGTRMLKWNDNANTFDRLWTTYQRNDTATNNDSKNNPCLTADLFGDWREEIVYRNTDSTALNIFTTTIPTGYKLTTLMHDSQYRTSIAWQNVAYNQPPYTSYYINEDMDLSALTSPNIYYAKTPVRLTFNVTSSNGTPIEGAEITMDSYSVATDSNGAAHIDVIAGDYTYTIRKQGYSTQRDVAVSIEDTTAQTVNITMQESDSYSVNAVTKTADGAIIRPEETVAEYKFAETSDYSFSLDDGYKEDITVDGKVYEMDFDASDSTKFTVEDDTLLTLIFKEKVTPGEGDTPIYSTNLGPNGYSSADENHGYTPSENASVSEYISDGSKYSVYRLGEDSVTRTLNGSYSDMVIEFDMIYTGDTSTSVGGDVVGLTVYNGNNQGTTAGIRFTGSLTPQICAFAGGSNYQTSTSVSSGTKLHYVLNYSGGTLTMSVANADTGEILTDDLVCGMRNSVGTAERPIDRIAFNRGNGSGTTPIGLSNVKIYQIGGPTEAVYPYSSHAAAAIGGETKFAPRSFKHLTDAGNIKIDLSGALTYAVKNQDGTEYAGNEVSIGNDGVVTVSEDAAKSYYRLDYIYNGKTVNTLDFRTADSEYGTFYSSAENGKLDDFVCGGGTDAMVSFSKSGWTLNQTNSIDGAEMYRDFNPVYGGTAELSFDFKMGAQRSDDGAGDYYKNYSFEIQFLDAEYDSEGNAINVLGGKEDLSGDNILFALSKVYSTTEREEVQYYSRGADKTYLSDTGTPIGESTRLHITNTTTWSIKVTFDFDNQTADMTILDSDGNGYAYSDIEIDADSFKTLRVVSKVDGVNAVTWKPVITNLSYSSTAYSPAEPTEIGAYGQSGTAYVSVEALDNGGADITEYVVSCEDPTGNVTTYSGATSPVAITGVTEGTYNFKASVKNAVGESNISDASASLTFSGINILPSEHGSVTTASALGAEGEEVKLSVEPEPGYMLDALTITDAGGGEIDYDGIQSIFTMPGQAVTITATFTEAPVPEGFSALGEDQISALSSKDATLYIAVYDAQGCLADLTERQLTANEAYIFALPQPPENGSVNAYIWDGETYEPLYDDLGAVLEQGIE